ncbi:hypothetical protein R1sor_009011 [Riccia sorocarpa]|uniref:Structural maintenance of chromosomes protein 5 n=1 Tax=Riccia sorocarpa TaxID=122646 RepID=A0ABD3H7B7_9MARC
MTLPSSSRPSKRAKTACRYVLKTLLLFSVSEAFTYGPHLQLNPIGPRLNLVIGPNGTGKSSLVCAICIGLGGEPQLLGRATMIGDYVKRGEESGRTKISLRGNSFDEAVVITRKINTRNKSDWLLNERPVPKKDILDVVQGFNIQLNNLTQFLPQDRVCEFAKLTPIQLLKAVGDPELSSQHKSIHVIKHLFSQTINSLESSLAQNKASNREIEEDGQRMRQRNELLLKAESLRKKLPWLKYDDKKAAFQTAKEAENEAKNKLRDAERNQAHILQPLEVLKRKRLVAEQAANKLKSASAECMVNMQEIANKEPDLCEKVRSKLQQIEEVHKREAARQIQIQKAKEDIATAEAELASLPP